MPEFDAVYRFNPFSEDPANYDGDTVDIDWSDPSSFFDKLNLPKPTSYPTAGEVRQESCERASKSCQTGKLCKRSLNVMKNGSKNDGG